MGYRSYPDDQPLWAGIPSSVIQAYTVSFVTTCQSGSLRNRRGGPLTRAFEGATRRTAIRLRDDEDQFLARSGSLRAYRSRFAPRPLCFPMSDRAHRSPTRCSNWLTTEDKQPKLEGSNKLRGRSGNQRITSWGLVSTRHRTGLHHRPPTGVPLRDGMQMRLGAQHPMDGTSGWKTLPSQTSQLLQA
jgi:hypothetical protein